MPLTCAMMEAASANGTRRLQTLSQEFFPVSPVDSLVQAMKRWNSAADIFESLPKTLSSSRRFCCAASSRTAACRARITAGSAGASSHPVRTRWPAGVVTVWSRC